MADVRYGMTLALPMALPAHLLYWFSIHGFIRFSRRSGPAVTLSFHWAVIVLLAYVIRGLAQHFVKSAVWRQSLSGLRWGFR